MSAGKSSTGPHAHYSHFISRNHPMGRRGVSQRRMSTCRNLTMSNCNLQTRITQSGCNSCPDF